jgi:transposase InsO family protein
LLRYHGRIWVGQNLLAQNHILQALHSSGTGGHSGVRATYERVKQYFAWPKLKQSVQAFVTGCAVCQQAKPEHVKSPGLLQALPVPTAPWEMISLDFIEGLPKSHGYDVIVVVVDRFTKYGHFLPMSHPFTALQVAQTFINNIYRLHGLPKVIVSDRDKIFTSTLWRELFRLSDTSLHMSSSYHPQSDGQTERLNQCLESYLRCVVQSCPKKWYDWLPLAEFWYNTAYHSSLGSTPFQVLYGQAPRSLGIEKISGCQAPDLESWLTERATAHDVLRQHILRAQRRMKNQADKKRSERQFEVGDLVYLKLQPFVQQSVAVRTNNKLSLRYF